MNEQESLLTIRKTVSQVLDIPEDQVPETASTATLPEWDSVAHLNIIMAIEDAFGVAFEPEQMLEMTSVQLIQAELAKKA